MEKLKKRGIHVYRTDLDGSITAACDGTTITWGTEKAGTLWQGGNRGGRTDRLGGRPAPTTARTPPQRPPTS